MLLMKSRDVMQNVFPLETVHFKTLSVHVSVFLGYGRLISVPLWTLGDNQAAGLSQR